MRPQIPAKSPWPAPHYLLVGGLALGLACATAPGRLPGVSPELRSAEAVIAADRERAAAMVTADRVRLERVLSPELRYTHSTGSVDDRGALIASLLGGEIDYRAITSPSPVVRLYGEVGLISGPVDMTVRFQGREFSVRSVYTAAYVLDAGRWTLVAYQSTSRESQTP